jgi:hypothetical protein
MKDLKPIIERNETNGISQAESVRDRIYDLFVKAAATQQVDVLILKSPPFAALPWVKVECWIHHPADSALTLRTGVELTIRPKEFHRFPIEIDMTISNDKRSRKWHSITSFEASDAKEVLKYLLYERKSHKFNFSRCRTKPFEFWLPLNTPARLGIDPMTIAFQILFGIGIVTVFISFILGLILLLIGSVVKYIGNKRRRHIISAGKPAQEPRQLISLDSWQTLVKDLGPECNTIKSDIQNELKQANDENLKIVTENIWHWGVDGKEEREQLVVFFRRGMAYIHIYCYGNDLYVGWAAHVNCGTWKEQVSGLGYDKTTQELCAVHTIVAGWHVPNEYDITDTNCLLERVHATVTKVLKRKLVEHHIDQEIDFKIIREQRQNISGRHNPDSASVTGGIRNIVSKFQRIG